MAPVAKFCGVVTGLFLLAALFDLVEWATVGWVVLGCLVLNGFDAYSRGKASLKDDDAA